MKTLGQNIRHLRRQKGWSQDIVAKQLGISIPALSKIENGITDINLSRLDQIAALFQISIVDLLILDEGNLKKKIDHLETINQKLAARKMEVLNLQKKVIELFEELRQSKVSA
jgi:transcriptional regulator with XRE-family HTH domain